MARVRFRVRVGVRVGVRVRALDLWPGDPGLGVPGLKSKGGTH